jgi:HEAT repeat protein
MDDGKTGDPVYGEALGWMLGDPDARVRKHAFLAIKAIKSAQSAEPQRT